ncbi:hypothetical protein Thi970DRAFT_00131 [Thiorhodovibrio frisius]|uniref:Uncharacterized protein n=2 Tax=Thiorhodovibrio frisius TaxID=631362 RepID=H8YVQ4_9GAMM|nr:hypothetical protein [Thiorhodovibrio frisius]EIC23994.1 hypothetical protein Thi970DRAFT_00131 [Thiorhodovibrio frisius]WPL23067.1 hypothetical protein Thiofri_03249 [Thiorhodovibrio frisius]
MSNNPLVAFLRTYGPSASADTMYDEHVLSAGERYGVTPIEETPPRLADVVENFRRADPLSIILTGTAGDGKTFHCRQAYRELGGNATDYATSGKMLVLPLPVSGKHLHIIKDLSDMSDAEKAFELDGIAQAFLGGDPGRVYLIAANDGQLLKYWRNFSDRHPDYRRVGQTLRSMLKDEQELDTDGRLALRLINLSRQPNHALFRKLLDRVVNHPQWANCTNCSAFDACPVRLNLRLLQADGDNTLRGRLSDLIRLAAANDAHLPVRQLLILITNILLGDRAPTQGDNLLTCQKARNRAADAERGYHATNPYQNVFGLNLREKIRQQYHVFRTLNAFGIGRETSNAIDDLLIYGAQPDNQGSLPEAEPCYGSRLFEPLRKDYLRGSLKNFDDFRYAIEGQRRRLFFDTPANRTDACDPWRLTIFQHGGDYLRFMERMAQAPQSESEIRAKIILGLNRTFTGTLCENLDALWVASPAANGYDRLGRVLECPPIALESGGFNVLAVLFDSGGLAGRPRLKVVSRMKPDEPLAALELRPLLFEYLLRVADGSLPSSFSRQCYEEVRQFRLKLVSQLRAELSPSIRNKLDLVKLDEYSGKLQHEPMTLSSPAA